MANRNQSKFQMVNTTGIHPKAVHALLAPSVYGLIKNSDPKASKVSGHLQYCKLGKGKTIKAIIVSNGNLVNQIRGNIDSQAVYNNQTGKMAIVSTQALLGLKTCHTQHKIGIYMCDWKDIEDNLSKTVYNVRTPSGIAAAEAAIAKLSRKK